MSILPQQKLEPNVEELTIGYESDSSDVLTLKEANIIKSSQKLQTENHLFRDRSKQIANHTPGSRKFNNWVRKK
jgi:hypothetical protein